MPGHFSFELFYEIGTFRQQTNPNLLAMKKITVLLFCLSLSVVYGLGQSLTKGLSPNDVAFDDQNYFDV